MTAAFGGGTGETACPAETQRQLAEVRITMEADLPSYGVGRYGSVR